MRKTVEIITTAYEKPFVTECMYNDDAKFLKIKWKQKHEGDHKETFYDISMDKETGIATITRKGEIRSILSFNTAERTKAVFMTPYGEITLDIDTHYINMPSVLADKFEIGYDIRHDDGNVEKNVFAVRFVKG